MGYCLQVKFDPPWTLEGVEPMRVRDCFGGVELPSRLAMTVGEVPRRVRERFGWVELPSRLAKTVGR
jgi:hypothetical protein